ncbi:hypothetical protein [Salmonella enterica]|uniref:hypothetical protein n=1 Tax=Salmonella enterica TaxID=28901 RepID=UPI0038572975
MRTVWKVALIADEPLGLFKGHEFKRWTAWTSRQASGCRQGRETGGQTAGNGRY